MFKVLCPTLSRRLHVTTPIRTFLSEAYYCREIWESRLNSPILQKINLDLLYHDLDQRFQKTRRISPVDVDIFANAVKDAVFIDELLDLVHKLRLSRDTGGTLNSTGHAVIRTLLDQQRFGDLLRVLDDRLNYGLFLDDYTANILMDTFWKAKNFVGGCVIASQMMLQEDFKHPITTNLALLHCYSYLLQPGEWPQPEQPEEPEEDVKVRVKYLRNPYNDEHFDLREPQKIVGKTLVMATKHKKDVLHNSLKVIGLALLNKEDALKKEIEHCGSLIKDLVEVLPEELPVKQELLALKLDSENVGELLEKQVTESVKAGSEKDIANQCELFAKWENERLQALEDQKKRLVTAERLAEIENLKNAIKEKEQKLWFFENEEAIELSIQQHGAQAPETHGQQTKIEENYVPPEVGSRKT